MQIIIIPSGEDFKNKNTAAVIHTMEIATNLSKNNSVILFALTSNNKVSPKENLPNLKIKYLPHYSNQLIRWIFKLLILPFYFFVLFSKTKSNIVYTRFGSIALSSLIAAKLTRKKYIVEVNGLKIDELKMTKKKSILRSFQIEMVKVLERIIYKFSNKIIAVAKGIKKEISKMYNIPLEKIEIIFNGVDTDLFKQIENAKENLRLSLNYRYIGFVGNLTRWQGVEYLIKAAPKIIRKNSLVKFLIIGDGPNRTSLENLVRKLKLECHFIFTGKINYKKVPLYINSFDICIAPFQKGRIASPLKILEFMACGKPVVSSNIEDVANIFRNKKDILLFEANNHNDLADKINFALRNFIFVSKIAESGKNLVIQKYTWQITSRKIEEVLKNFLY